jgi:hypothetical protein
MSKRTQTLCRSREQSDTEGGQAQASGETRSIAQTSSSQHSIPIAITDFPNLSYLKYFLSLTVAHLMPYISPFSFPCYLMCFRQRLMLPCSDV